MSKTGEKAWYLWTQTIYSISFGKIGKRSLIYKPIQIDGRKGIYIDDDVYISQNAWLMGNGKSSESLHIESGTTIGHYAHIIAMESVTIEKNVLIADKVFISDCTHRYEDMDKPIKQQSIEILSPVVIGEDSWLGENVCVCGANIGKHCVIGANSVVSRDIPDYCVAVGSPAKIIKKYDFSQNKWVRVE